MAFPKDTYENTGDEFFYLLCSCLRFSEYLQLGILGYSLRGFFITMSLHNGVDAQKLANSLGTSPRMIDQTYDDFQTEAEMDELTRRAGIAEISKVKWDDNGYPILRK